MRCADDAVLWQAAQADAGADADAKGAPELQAHLSGCAACQDRLAAVRQTRALLRGVNAHQSATAPQVDWARADRQVLSAAAAHVARRPWWQLPTLELRLGAVGALAAVVLAVWFGLKTDLKSNDGAVAPVAPMVAFSSTVESAEDAHVTDPARLEEALLAGKALKEGAKVRIAGAGSAILRLPDESRALLGAGSTATVTKARPDEVALGLESGDLVVQAAHVPRQSFLVDAGVAQVRVVGTAFRVTREGDRVEVSVAEGRVLVEPRRGDARMLGAGERGIIGADGAWIGRLEDDDAHGSRLNEGDERAFAALGIQAQAAPEPDLELAPQPSIPAAAPTPSPATSRRVAVEQPRAPRTNAQTQTKTNAQSGGAVAEAVTGTQPEQPEPEQPSAPTPGTVHEDWATPEFKPPQEKVAARPPGLAERAKASGLPVTAEGLFLQRAQESLKAGRCGSFLVGLQDVLEVSEDPTARERARILRARCYDERLEPVAAEREYRKYLMDYPHGRFASEARRAVPDP